MTAKEYKKKYIKGETARIRIMYWLWIIQFRVLDHNESCVKRVNPFNPLSYIVIILIMVVAALTEVIGSISEIKDEFKYH